ncbi:MAG: PilN domain-containing protein [Bdellovibrionota bacterium]
MIKVNLLKDAGKKQKKGGDSTILDSDFRNAVGGAVGENNAIIKRVAFLIIPIIVVFAYTWHVESGLKSDVEKLNKQAVVLDGQLEALKPELNTIEQLKGEKNKLSTELGAIKELSKKRYTYVKILDSLQSLIPEKAWVTKLTIKDQIISIEGRAIEDAIISSFMQNLEESAYFSNVTWVNSAEVNEPQGLVKSFSIRLDLENI